MSTSFHIVCINCREHEWIGQSSGAGSGKPWIYRGEDEVKKLSNFLCLHQDHILQYVSEFMLECILPKEEDND